MTSFRLWKSGAGALSITIKPLRPFIFSPALSLLAGDEKVDFSFSQQNAAFTTSLNAEQVAKLTASPTAAGAPFLFLTANAAFKPGAPDRKWQWGIKFERGGASLPCFDKDGAAILPGPEGLITSTNHSFPSGQAGGSETWIISLS